MSKNNTKIKVIEEESNDEISETMDENDDIMENEDNFEENDDLDDDYNEIDELEETETFTGCILDKIIDDTYDDNEDEIKEEITETKILKGKDRISANRLTKYEMVRILGERTKQLTMGAKPLIKNYEGLNYDKIAEEELKLNMIPFKIKRPLPNGKYEFWTLDELFKDHLMTLLE